MATFPIAVSIDRNNNITCNDISGVSIGDSVEWKPDSSVTSLSVSVLIGSLDNTPSSSNSYTSKIQSSGGLASGGRGVSYNVWVNGVQKTKSPHITTNTPI